ncbi:hypothetical protein [Tenacibaculum sp. 190524A02b]|uniref:hypothetical protein n=1 Tax=Tenacibaculum vairaonense TaxID=3137860 RepID=UPI0031FAAF75
MDLCIEDLQYTLTVGGRNCYQLDLGFKVIDFTFCQLLAFRKKILWYTSYESIEAIIEGDNFLLLSVADNQHILYIEIPQLLALRNVILAAFNTPELT